jgi:putative phosphoesterase
VIAAIYDIHGNLPALRAVLSDAARQGVSGYVIGGDVAAGPLPAETIGELTALTHRAEFVRGNADREVVDAYDRGQVNVSDVEDPAARAAVYAAGRISLHQRDFLDSFLPSLRIEVPGLGDVLFCHGSPRSDSEILTSITPERRLSEVLALVEEATVVCGHTHQQFDRTVGGVRVINAGSVGIPYEGRPGAYWALLGPGVELRRTEYDLRSALDELEASGFPDLHEMVRDSLLDPADPGEVARLFEGQAT